jgi:hypothetical protein
MRLEDLCFEVCTALDQAATRAVLTGGSAATFYAPQAYQSLDADFVITFGNSSDAAKALERLGFVEKNGLYRRESTEYTLEFPPGPLAIGSEYITAYSTYRRESEVLYVLHAADCVRDRLLWYYHYNDFSALGAAIGVAQAHQIDITAIRDWSAREGASEKFETFHRQIAMANFRGSQ